MTRGHAYIQINGSTENIGGSGQCKRMFVQEVSFAPIWTLGFGTEFWSIGKGPKLFKIMS